jgi:hypothetical protein
LAFEKINNEHEFDYIFRTNTSSFIDFKKFENFLKTNKSDISYSGRLTETIEGITIASGAGFFISKENVSTILEDPSKFNHLLPDDVAIAEALSQKSIFPSDLDRIEIKNVPKPNTFDNDPRFHFRCRLDPQYHRILEPIIFRYLNFISKNKNITLRYFFYIVVKILFAFSNVSFVRKLIQKYYSYKFYGVFQIKKYIIFKDKRIRQ